MIHRSQAVEHNLPIGSVLIHINFLTDNTLLLFNGSLRKIGILNEIKKNFKILFEVSRAREKISRSVKARVSIRRSARLCEALKCVKILAFKELVLKEMSRTLGNLLEFAVLHLNHRIN